MVVGSSEHVDPIFLCAFDSMRILSRNSTRRRSRLPADEPVCRGFVPVSGSGPGPDRPILRSAARKRSMPNFERCLNSGASAQRWLDRTGCSGVIRCITDAVANAGSS